MPQGTPPTPAAAHVAPLSPARTHHVMLPTPAAAPVGPPSFVGQLLVRATALQFATVGILAAAHAVPQLSVAMDMVGTLATVDTVGTAPVPAVPACIE